MLELIKAFVAIALRRKGPEDLPASRFLLGVTLASYLLVQIPVALIVFGATGTALRTVFADIALLAVCLWMLLYLTSKATRYVQTLSALLGTSALLSALAIPFNLWRGAVDDPAAAPGLPTAVILMLLIWSLVIDGHIVGRALSRPFMLGLGIAIGYFFLHTTLLFEFLPAPE
jgi:hypothetical protein